MASKFSTAMLTSLTTAAIAIPGMAYAQQETTAVKNAKPTKEEKSSKTEDILKGGMSKSKETPKISLSGITNDFKFTRYHEDGARYDVNVWQNLLIVPLEKLKFTLELQRDSQSGASSYVIRPKGLQDPTLFPTMELFNSRTGATIVDDRNQITLTTEYGLEDSKYDFTVYHSQENDFLATGIGASGTWEFNKSNTILNCSTSFTAQKVMPTLAGFFAGSQLNLGRISGNNRVHKLFIALKQDLSIYNYAQVSTEFENQSGYLSEPYKFVAVYGDARSIARFFAYTAPGLFPAGATQIRQNYPTTRNIFTPVLRFVQYVPWTDGSVHFDYRYSRDSWCITSNTFEVSYYQPFLENWEIAPLFRYYTQGAADFYGPTFNATNGTAPFPSKRLTRSTYAGDYRLARFGSKSYEIKISYQAFAEMKLGLTAGYYKRKADYSMSRKDPIPHLEIDGKGVGSKYLGIDFNLKF